MPVTERVRSFEAYSRFHISMFVYVNIKNEIARRS